MAVICTGGFSNNTIELARQHEIILLNLIVYFDTYRGKINPFNTSREFYVCNAS